MGNQTGKEFTFYSVDEHPIEGKVTVYTIQGEGLFIMSKLLECNPSIEMQVKRISSEDHPNVLKFYGLEDQQSPIITCSNQCTESSKNLKLSYWEYLNHDLQKQMKKKKLKITDHFLWDLIEGTASAGSFFKKHKVYIEFKPKLIEFGVEMLPKIYWVNNHPENVHRSYFRYFYRGDYKKAYYSPQEMASIKSGIQNYKLNLEKCSVFSLGITILSFVVKSNLIDAYNFEKKEINESMILQALEVVRKKHGPVFEYVLSGMVEFFVFKRKNFDQIKEQAKLARKGKLEIPKVNKQTATNSLKSQHTDSFCQPDQKEKKSIRS